MICILRGLGACILDRLFGAAEPFKYNASTTPDFHGFPVRLDPTMPVGQIDIVYDRSHGEEACPDRRAQSQAG